MLSKSGGNDPVIADERKGLYHHLSIIAGVGQCFQIASHPGGKNSFPNHRLDGSKDLPLNICPFSNTRYAFCAITILPCILSCIPVLVFITGYNFFCDFLTCHPAIHGLFFNGAMGLRLRHIQILDEQTFSPVYQTDLFNFSTKLTVFFFSPNIRRREAAMSLMDWKKAGG